MKIPSAIGKYEPEIMAFIEEYFQDDIPDELDNALNDYAAQIQTPKVYRGMTWEDQAADDMAHRIQTDPTKDVGSIWTTDPMDARADWDDLASDWRTDGLKDNPTEHGVLILEGKQNLDLIDWSTSLQNLVEYPDEHIVNLQHKKQIELINICTGATYAEALAKLQANTCHKPHESPFRFISTDE